MRIRAGVAVALLAAVLATGAPRAEAVATDVAPFASIDAFVKQQYRDFTGRDPFALELSNSRSGLVDGTDTLADAVTEIAHRDDGSVRTCNVTRLFSAYFLRLPDISGENYWVGKARAGTTLIKISNSFAASNEFKRRYGSLTNAGFVDLAYQNVFGRAPDSGGRTYWINKLNNGMSRGQVMAGYSTSGEYSRKKADLCDVVLAYFGLLQRMPTASEATEGEADVADKGFVGLAAELLARPQWAARFPAPGAPTGVTAIGGDAQAKVSWTAPSNKGTGIVGYIVRPSIGGLPLADRTAGASATSLTVTGLTNGSTYTFAVYALTQNVMGPAGTSTPTLVKPEVVWSTVGGNAAHTNVQPNGTVPASPVKKWERTFGDDTPSQVVVGAGRIYVLLPGSSGTSETGGRVYALDPANGNILWGPSSIAASYQDAYVGYADGRVVLRNSDGLVRALNASTGALLWSRNLGGSSYDSEGVTIYGGSIYVPDDNGIAALDAATGVVRWRKSVGNGTGTPGVDASGVYISQVCDDYKFSSAGTQIWHVDRPCTGGGGGHSSPFAGKVWTDGDWGGTPQILQQSNGAVFDSYTSNAMPALQGDRAFYDDGGTLTAVEFATGLTKWSQAGDGHLQGSPVINSGRIYISSEEGIVYGFGTTSGTPTWERTVIDDLATPVDPWDTHMGQVVIGDGLLLVPTSGSLLAYG